MSSHFQIVIIASTFVPPQFAAPQIQFVPGASSCNFVRVYLDLFSMAPACLSRALRPSSSLTSLVLSPRHLRPRLPRHPSPPRVPYSRSLSRDVHSREFQPFVPPSPSSLGKPTPAKTYHRTRKWLRRIFYLSVATGVVYALDTQFYASSLTRTARTFSLGLLVALDYKVNFRPNPPLANSITDVHARNAERLSDLLRHNGGLYLKIGQAIAMQSAILPPEFQKMFSRMFDDAPQNDWKDVDKVIRQDFGKSAEEVFGVSFNGDPTKGVMERTARASASVAQVHWARLADGREIAIKIQKREIARQIKWDLWAFKYDTYPVTCLVPSLLTSPKSRDLDLQSRFRYPILQPCTLCQRAPFPRDRF